MSMADSQARAKREARAADALHLDPSERAFWVGLVIVVLSLISALTSYLILTGLTPITPRDDVVLGALLINVALISAMLAIVVWQFLGLWRAWRNNVPGARLHVRIVALFSLIAALPAIVLAIAATTTFSRALDSWFSTRTRAIINQIVPYKAHLCQQSTLHHQPS